MQALESSFGNEYLNGSLLATLPPLSELPLSLNSDKRGSLPNFSTPDVVKSNFASSSTLPMKRNSSSGPNYRLGVQPPKKRLSTIGAASSHARLYKMLGDFFLLAGRTEDSIIW